MINDLSKSIRSWRIWLYLPYRRMLNQYKRNSLSLWFNIINSFILYIPIIIAYQKIFKPVDHYYIYAWTGLFTWNFISSTMGEIANTFKNSSLYLLELPLPYNTFLFKTIITRLLSFLHIIFCFLVLIPLYALYYHISMPINFFALIAGLLALLFILLIYGGIFAVAATRFGDASRIMMRGLNIIYIMTPVIWEPSVLPEDSKFFATYNPCAAVINLIRAPLTGSMITLNECYILMLFTFIGMVMFALTFSTCRKRIIFWL